MLSFLKQHIHIVTHIWQLNGTGVFFIRHEAQLMTCYAVLYIFLYLCVLIYPMHVQSTSRWLYVYKTCCWEKRALGKGSSKWDSHVDCVFCKLQAVRQAQGHQLPAGIH